MDEVRLLYVDSNIFIRLFEGNDELSRALASLFVAVRPGAPPILATYEFTLAELLVVPYREKNDQLIQLYDNWTTTNANLIVGPVDRDVLWYAAVLRSQYPSLKLPDAIHVSSAIGLQCSHILTADQRLTDRYELVHTRWGRTKGPVPVDVVRPEISTINKIVEQVSA